MTDAPDELADLRDDIDRLDDEIADLVTERIRAAEAIAAVKDDAGRDLVDEDREETVKSRYGERFERAGFDAADGRGLAEYLIETSLEREAEVAGEP